MGTARVEGEIGTEVETGTEGDRTLAEWDEATQDRDSDPSNTLENATPIERKDAWLSLPRCRIQRNIPFLGF